MDQADDSELQELLDNPALQVNESPFLVLTCSCTLMPPPVKSPHTCNPATGMPSSISSTACHILASVHHNTWWQYASYGPGWTRTCVSGLTNVTSATLPWRIATQSRLQHHSHHRLIDLTIFMLTLSGPFLNLIPTDTFSPVSTASPGGLRQCPYPTSTQLLSSRTLYQHGY